MYMAFPSTQKRKGDRYTMSSRLISRGGWCKVEKVNREIRWGRRASKATCYKHIYLLVPSETLRTLVFAVDHHYLAWHLLLDGAWVFLFATRRNFNV